MSRHQQAKTQYSEANSALLFGPESLNMWIKSHIFERSRILLTVLKRFAHLDNKLLFCLILQNKNVQTTEMARFTNSSSLSHCLCSQSEWNRWISGNCDVDIFSEMIVQSLDWGQPSPYITAPTTNHQMLWSCFRHMYRYCIGLRMERLARMVLRGGIREVRIDREDQLVPRSRFWSLLAILPVKGKTSTRTCASLRGHPS